MARWLPFKRFRWGFGYWFWLVLTVCDNAQEQCPTFPKKVKTVHLPFPDPDGLEFEKFKTLWKDMKTKITPTVQELLNK